LNVFKVCATVLLNTFNIRGMVMTFHPEWRPQPQWIPAGLLLGATCGALVGIVTMSAWTLVDGFDGVSAVDSSAMLGGVFGGATGLVVGAVAGTVMTFLVGRHLPHEEARDRAALVGTLATTFVLAIALAYMVPVYVVALPALALGMLCAGPLCLWLAGTRPFRPDVS